MDKKTITELKGILTGLKAELTEMQKTVIPDKAISQIKNLQDKIENRKLLPDFTIVIKLEDMQKAKKDKILSLSQFFKAVNVEVTKEQKQALKNLQIRVDGLEAMKELQEPEPEPETKK